MKNPFKIGQKVTKWKEYEETMGKTILTIIKIEKSDSHSGWCVWASSEVCPCCGHAGEKWKDLDSDWFVKVK